ncbi:hypothetical protein B9Z19DRAFT_1126859 [Tuber borchii]|uniref:Uncharacterized protein n=1 Tax=Tuber borchii TaxID=42251 RepID=A0A2T6ZS85_TUBBO|nr:hypothetical protein B9Z19DRAFT_1126859 [Tuber borchii]
MTSNGRNPQGSTRGPGLGTSQGAPNNPSESAPRSRTNDSITLPPSQSDLEPLVEIQKRLHILLSETAPGGPEQGAELRELTDQVVLESGTDQETSIMLQEVDDG